MKKFYFIITACAFLLPFSAIASTQVLMGGVPNAGAGSATYAFNAYSTQTSNAGHQSGAWPVSGEINNLKVTLNYAPTGAQSRTFTVFDDGTDWGLTCTISAGATTCQDTSDEFLALVGDYINMGLTSSGSPPNATITWSADFTPTNSNDTVIVGGVNNAFSATTEDYGVFSMFTNITATLSQALQVFPETGTVDQFQVGTVSSSPGTSKNWLWSVFAANATTTLACNQAGSATSCSDTTDSVSVSPGNTFTMAGFATTTPTALGPGWGMRYVPTNAGDFGLFASSLSGSDAAGATRYLTINGATTLSAVEASTSQVTASAMTITSMTVSRSATVGSGHTVTYTLDDNGSPTSLSCVIAGGSVTSETCTGSVSVAAGDILDTSIVVTTGGTTAKTQISYVANASPPSPPTLSPLHLLTLLNGYLIVGANATPTCNLAEWGAGGEAGWGNLRASGGGAGAYVAATNIPIKSGTGYTITVGTGGISTGTGGTGYASGGSATTDGGGGGGGSSAADFTPSGGSLYIAAGGGGGSSTDSGHTAGGGTAASGTTGGTGGSTGGGSSEVPGGGGAGATNGANASGNTGGSGGTGATSATGTSGNGFSQSSNGFGGGGSSAGASGNGANATSGTGATGSGGATPGSNGSGLDSGGGGSSSSPGTPGGVPGAGGGAGISNRSGSGGNGEDIIYCPLGAYTATGGTHTTDATYDYWTFTSSGTWTPRGSAGGSFFYLI